MELNREHFRAMIYYDVGCGLSQRQYIDQFTSTFDNEATSKTIGLMNSNMADLH